MPTGTNETSAADMPLRPGMTQELWRDWASTFSARRTGCLEADQKLNHGTVCLQTSFTGSYMNLGARIPDRCYASHEKIQEAMSMMPGSCCCWYKNLHAIPALYSQND